MNDLIDTDGRQKSPPPLSTCTRCGGITLAMSILDSRQGKSYRLRRCITCEKLNWAEED
ncbi:hypothetical protein AB7M45_007772 [Bradyrhizobium elkanii]|uniref:hypothetical protein n=1 Tax=Bradyrhizobium elkanii TaxID=29448 RepID=UPI0014444202|nr:hypothetical protein [Bradyrhizobium elkanii]MCW2195001.1 hypothetical protein [Bradyrhizobium elkanii]